MFGLLFSKTTCLHVRTCPNTVGGSGQHIFESCMKNSGNTILNKEEQHVRAGEVVSLTAESRLSTRETV